MDPDTHAGPRDQGDVVAQHLRRLAELSDVALSELSLDDLLEELLARLRELMHADTAAVLLLDESGQFLTPTATYGLEEEVRQGVRVPLGRGFAGTVAARGEPVVLDHVDASNVVNPILLRKGLQSMLGVPLFEGPRVLGVLHVGSLTPRSFDENDIAMLRTAAERVTTAVTTRRSYIDREAARSLQRSLSPRQLPTLAGYRFAARYVAGSQYGVSGDWYDVFGLPGDRIGIVIGDVMGHGLRAATTMGRVKSALRAYALDYDDPATVVAHVDRKLHHFEPGQTATLVYAILRPATGELRYSSAGHLPLAFAAAGQPTRLLLDRHGLPLGVDPERPRGSSRIVLQPGSLVCGITDGLLDQREVVIDDALEAVLDELDQPDTSTDPAEAACQRLMSTFIGTRRAADDVTVLVMTRDA